jgi:hypothetical protein
MTSRDLTDFDLEHLLSHIEHDVSHSGDMLANITEGDRASVAKGAAAARIAWQEFWKEVN